MLIIRTLPKIPSLIPTRPLIYRFSKLSKFSLSASKYLQHFDGFLIYQNMKTKSFRRFGVVLSLLGAYSALVYFYFCDETSRPVYLPLLLLSGTALLVYEFKMRMTTKFITLDRRGELLMLVYYKWLGFGVKSVQIPVNNVLGPRNYSKWLKVPGYGYKLGNKSKFAFIDREGVKEEEALSEIMKGNPIKIMGVVKTGDGRK